MAGHFISDFVLMICKSFVIEKSNRFPKPISISQSFCPWNAVAFFKMFFKCCYPFLSRIINSDHLFSPAKSFIQPSGIFTAGCGKMRLAATTTANFSGKVTDNSSGIQAFLINKIFGQHHC